MRKRLLAIIATAAMVVAMMPSMVFAAPNVAKIGTDEYATLDAAVTAANTATSPVVIELLSNVELNKGIAINNPNGVSVKINGGGNKITSTSTFSGLVVTVKSDVIIEDVVFDGIKTNSDIVNAYKNADLTITKCSFLNNECRSVIRTQSGYANTVDVTKATFKGNTASEGVIYCGDGTGEYNITDCIIDNNISTSAAAPVSLPGTVSITGSKFTDNKTTSTWPYAASAAYCWGEDVKMTGNTISGNTVEATGSTAAATLIVKTGAKDIDLSGNTIDSTNVVKIRATASDALAETEDVAIFVRDNGTGTVNISSGTISGTVDSANGEGISITGGTFDKDVSDYIGGLVQDGNGNVVKPSGNNSNAPIAPPESSPNTGDNSMAPFAIAGIALAAMAAVVATRRREN